MLNYCHQPLSTIHYPLYKNMRFKLLLVIAITTLAQIANTIPAQADSTQIEKLVSQNNLANAVVEPRGSKISIGTNGNQTSLADTTQTSEIPSATELIAQSKRKQRRPAARRKPLAKPATAPNTTAPADTPTSGTPAADNQKQVIVSGIVIQNAKGTLSPELESKIRQVLTVKTGQPTTRTQLEQNLNAIRALGAFSSVEIVPKDTSKGVELSFIVTPYGVLNQVSIKTLPANSSSVLKQSDVDSIFQKQYGKQLNAVELQAAIKQLNQFYQSQGYNLAQVVDVEELGADGKLNLVIAEGLIEDVQVRFLTKDGSLVDDKKQPIKGLTRPFIVTREAELKPGKIFNRATAEKDLRRIYGLGIFDDVRVSFAPGTDPAKVILQLNVIERKTSAILAGGGISSTNGLFGSVSYNQLNVGGNGQKLGAEVQIGSTGTLYNINFSDPWIATDPNRTSYTVNIFQQRSLSTIFEGGKTPLYIPDTTDVPRIQRQGGGITFGRPLNGDPFSDAGWRSSLGFQYQRVTIQDVYGNKITQDSGGNDLSWSKSGQDDLFLLQLGLTQDVRNSATDPTQGSIVKLGVDQSIPIGLGKIAMTRARGSFTQYVPVKLINFSPGSQSLLFNVQGGTIFGDLPPYEAFSLGGSTSVRGYEDGDVGSGRSYVQATAEYRFPIVSIVGGGLFADYGSDLGTGNSVPGNPAGARSKPGSGLGYGAGLRIQSPIGSIRVDYALNSQGGSVVQFGIGERF